jgi:ubiquinone/menaquinone biosynthesis C-methylase UbiE
MGRYQSFEKTKDLSLDGLEASADMVRVATKNAKNEGISNRAQYFQGIGEEMSTLPDEHYDLVISRDSLHHGMTPNKCSKKYHEYEERW